MGGPTKSYFGSAIIKRLKPHVKNYQTELKLARTSRTRYLQSDENENIFSSAVNKVEPGQRKDCAINFWRECTRARLGPPAGTVLSLSSFGGFIKSWTAPLTDGLRGGGGGRGSFENFRTIAARKKR